MLGSTKLVKRKVHACAICRKLKSKCDGLYPCNQCFKASLPCTPQLRVDEEPIPIDERTLNRADPRAMVEGFMQAFNEAFTEGILDRECTIRAMRIWRETSLLVGNDTSWGLLDLICQRTGISPVEIEGPRALALGGSAQGRRQLAQETLARGLALSQELKNSDTFRLLDDGQSALCLMIMEADGAIARSTNQACDRMFRTMMEMYDDFTIRRTSSMLLSAAFINPDDRPAWFRLQLEACFVRNCQPRPVLAKSLTKDGNIDLYIFSCRVVQVNGRPTHCFTTQRAPTNRHVTDAPNRGRQHGQQQQQKPRANGGHLPWPSPRTGSMDDDDGGGVGGGGSRSASVSSASVSEPPRHVSSRAPTTDAPSTAVTAAAAARAGAGPSSMIAAAAASPPQVVALPGIASLPVPPVEPSEEQRLLTLPPLDLAFSSASKGEPPRPALLSPSPRASSASSLGSALADEEGAAATDIFRTRPEVMAALMDRQAPALPGAGAHSPPRTRPRRPTKRGRGAGGKEAAEATPGGEGQGGADEGLQSQLGTLSPFPEYPSPAVPLLHAAPPPQQQQHQQLQLQQLQQGPAVFYGVPGQVPQARSPAPALVPVPMAQPPSPLPLAPGAAVGQEMEAEVWAWLESGLADSPPPDALAPGVAVPPPGERKGGVWRE